MTKTRTARKWYFLASALSIVVVLFATIRAASWLDVGQFPPAVDYVYILPGHAETRPFVGGFLVRQGFARKALIPTVALSPEQKSGIALSHHEVTTRVLKYCGIPDSKIVTLDISSTSTADESRALASFVADRPQVQVAVLTSAYHTRRARWIFTRALGGLADHAVYLSAPNPDFRADQWWRTPAGLRTVTSEYLKLFFYWFRYGWGLYCLGTIAALVTLFSILGRWPLLQRRQKRTT